MKTKPAFNSLRTAPLLLLLSALNFPTSILFAQNTVFTYQGRLTDNGTNFSGAGQFKFALVTSTNDSQQATAVANPPSGGFITIINVTFGGKGYVSAPTVTISGGGGANATATSQISSGGVVTNITVINPGSGYTSTPTVTVAPPPLTVDYTTWWSNDGSSVNGSQPTTAVTVSVSNGLFTVVLGDTNLANMTAIDAALFLQLPDLQLRIWFSDNVNPFAALDPVQNLTPTPYAVAAINVTGPINGSQIAAGTITAGDLASNSITGGQLASGAAAANLSAGGQTAVPSGGIILSGNANDTNLESAGYIKLGKATLGDVWAQGSTSGAPSSRNGNSAVWTGSEMIVWGGSTNGGPSGVFYSDGARYNPALDSWTAVTTNGAPIGRDGHTAVWTGSQMIVWGGENYNFGALNSGGRYDPVANTWTPVTTNGAPSARQYHTAIWTGSQMIVWGGSGNLNTGGLYNPATDTWTPVTTNGAPSGRYLHAAVWTGTEMIVWGGTGAGGFATNGGRYNPVSNTWTQMTTNGAPQARTYPGAVWTGTQMIVWGGNGNIPGGYFNDGGVYTPASDSWTAVTTNGAPTARALHAQLWIGNEMFVWGGFGSATSDVNTGGIYDPVDNSWIASSINSAPAARENIPAVWTGDEIIIWGGDNRSNLIGYTDTPRYTPARLMYLYQRP